MATPCDHSRGQNRRHRPGDGRQLPHPLLDPGQTFTVKIRVAVRQTAPAGARVDATLKATLNPDAVRTDTVRSITNRRLTASRSVTALRMAFRLDRTDRRLGMRLDASAQSHCCERCLRSRVEILHDL